MTAIAINSNSWPRVPLIYLHLTSLSARHSVPDAHTFGASSCLPSSMMSGLRRIPSIYGFHELKSTDLSLSRGKQNWHPCFRLSPPFLVPTPSAPRTSSCVYCFKSQKSEAKTSEKKWPNADAFYLLNYIDCVSAGSRRFRGGCVCVCPPDTAVVPSSGVRPRGVWKSIFPRRSCVFFCSGLFSGAHGRHLASKLSSSSSPRVLC